MGACHTYYDEIRFNVFDPDVTHVYVFIRGEGDCPFPVHGWHHKAFPATMTTLDIHNLLWNGEDPVLWQRADPPKVV